MAKELRTPPLALINDPFAEAGPPASEPRDVPVISTSDGTPTAAEPEEVVPDKPLQTSAEPATIADPPGPTAESGACTTDALGTVEQTPKPVKPSEVTITEGFLPEGTTHSSGDLTASKAHSVPGPEHQGNHGFWAQRVGCSSPESLSHPPWCPDPSCPSQRKQRI